VRTYSAHRRVTGSGHPLNGGLGGYCLGHYPRYRGPPVMAQTTKYDGLPIAAHRWGPHIQCQEMTLLLKAVHMGPQLKMNQTGWRTTLPLLHPLIMRGPAGFRHLAALSIHPRRRPGPLYARRLLDTAKYRPTLVSGSVGPKHQPRWDVAFRAHMPLALGTRVGIYPTTA
jgi:hypothetical protein